MKTVDVERLNKKYTDMMRAVSSPEDGRVEADRLLINLLVEIGGFDDLLDEYDRIPKWYG